MNTSNKNSVKPKLKVKGSKRHLFLFGIPYIILIIVMLVASLVFIFRVYGNGNNHNDIPGVKPYVVKLVLPGSTPADSLSAIPDTTIHVSANKVASFLDTLGRTIVDNQEVIKKRQDDLISDIRQETNNNLDKHSAWLAFWITVLGFIGVVCPIAYQYVNTKYFESVIIQSKEDLAKSTDEIKHVQAAYNIKMIVMSFESVCANKHLEDDNCNVRQMYISSVKSLFSKYLFELQKEEREMRDSEVWFYKKIHVYSVLANLEAFLYKILINARYEETRRIQATIDNIKRAMDSVARSTDYTRAVRKQLTKVSECLSIV